MRPIKILHVIPTLDQSGAEKQLALLVSHLPRDRFETTVCALTRGGFYEDRLREAGAEAHVLGKRFKWDPMALWRLRDLIRETGPDVVQSWLFAGNCYGRVAGWWAGAPRLIASERCVDSWKRQYQFAIDRRLARWTDVVVANSKAVGEFYAKVGISTEKLRVITNAVERSDGALADREAKLAELGIPPDRPTLGFIGRLWPQKRVHDLIWAADVLTISGWNLHVIIIGAGPRRAALERFSHSLELEDVTHFLGHRRDAEELLAAIDVLVIPSRFEGTPNVALEAMQAGKPIVASRIAGMDEVVVDGETGLLVEPKQPFALAQALGKLLKDPQLRERMGEAGRRRVNECFTVQRMTAAYQQLYEELAGVDRSDDP
jgi:glycosyltransferase involved in cell wall biosynthesis